MSEREKFIPPEEAGKLKDVIQKRNISERIEEWGDIKITKHPFLNFYVACPESKLDTIFEYIRERLDIDKENVIISDTVYRGISLAI